VVVVVVNVAIFSSFFSLSVFDFNFHYQEFCDGIETANSKKRRL
jgi:hypothetical protein